ncbi:hypothetical protein QZH41_019820 [Actinostola sp. cb2023]|nr:hypothetical protein QZH41_019820 [Actinostola sp. cb2023]
MDSEYLKKHVGVALSLGLTEIVQKRPVDPIEYLAFWMRKFVENRDFEDKFILNTVCRSIVSLKLKHCLSVVHFETLSVCGSSVTFHMSRKKKKRLPLAVEIKESEKEEMRRQNMKEEADVIARQEAYEKAAQEEVMIDSVPRPMPPEVLETLPSVAEGDETEEEKRK